MFCTSSIMSINRMRGLRLMVLGIKEKKTLGLVPIGLGIACSFFFESISRMIPLLAKHFPHFRISITWCQMEIGRDDNGHVHESVFGSSYT